MKINKLLIIVIFFALFYFISQINLQNSRKSTVSISAFPEIHFLEISLPTIEETNCGSIKAVDINNDGILDIIAGFQWFQGPSWIRHQYARKTMNTKIDAGISAVFDLDYDGDIDVVMQRRRPDGGRELIWFENPGSLVKNIWKRHLISNTVSCVEAIEFVDIDDDGRAEMVTVDDCAAPGLLIYEIPKDPLQQWPQRAVFNSLLHGLGIGDLNDDGRLDIFSDYQWFENQPDGSWIRRSCPSPKENFSLNYLIYRIKSVYRTLKNHQGEWATTLKLAASALAGENKQDRIKMNMQTLIWDIDDDGDKDIFVTQAHTYGAYWLESSGGSSPSFTLHKILSTPSQLHGVAYGDVDNDGDNDIFMGKSRYSHGDPGEKDHLDIFWLELQKDGDKIEWIKHTLSSYLVMGFQPLVFDIDMDGDSDLLMRGLSFGNQPQFNLTVFFNQIVELSAN